MPESRPRTRRRLGVALAAAFALAYVVVPAASALPPQWDLTFGAPLSISNDDDATTANVAQTHVTFGTVYNRNADVVRRTVDAVSGFGRDVLCTVGADQDPGQLVPGTARLATTERAYAASAP